MSDTGKLKDTITKFAESGWDLIAEPSKEWLAGSGDTKKLITAIEQADKECGSCGCEFDVMYKEVLKMKDRL